MEIKNKNGDIFLPKDYLIELSIPKVSQERLQRAIDSVDSYIRTHTYSTGNENMFINQKLRVVIVYNEENEVQDVIALSLGIKEEEVSSILDKYDGTKTLEKMFSEYVDNNPGLHAGYKHYQIEGVTEIYNDET